MTTENQARLAKILDILRPCGIDGMGTIQIANQLEVPFKTARDCLNQLLRSKRVARRGEYKETRWFLPEAGNVWEVPELPRAFFGLR